VLIMERWILGRLRNQRFHGLAALNEAICGGRMIIIETFERGCTPQYHPTAPIPIDSS
jgi:hypothetical protein